MTDARTVAKLFNEYEEASRLLNEADTAWDADCNNEELQAAADKAYEAEWDAFQALIDSIVDFSDFFGMGIDHHTATIMVTEKREDLRELCSRIA